MIPMQKNLFEELSTGGDTALLLANRASYTELLQSGVVPTLFPNHDKEVPPNDREKPIVVITAPPPNKEELIGIRREVATAIDQFSPLIIHAGMEPLLIAQWLVKISGVVIPGGSDLSRYWFDGTPTASDELQQQHDLLELQLVAWALNNGVPVMGICRGFQVMATLAGYSIHDISSDAVHHTDYPQVYSALLGASSIHQVTVFPDYSPLATHIAPPSASPTQLSVNSMHHQGTKGGLNIHSGKVRDAVFLEPGITFEIVGHSEDGVAEVGQFVRSKEDKKTTVGIGFQGHPEAAGHINAHPILKQFHTLAFQQFIETVMQYSSASGIPQ